MRRWMYQVSFEMQADGCRVVVEGATRVWVGGPFPDVDAAQHALWRLLRRWQRRAEALGGRAWRAEGRVLAVLLPDHVVPREALPFTHAPVTRAVCAPTSTSSCKPPGTAVADLDVPADKGIVGGRRGSFGGADGADPHGG